MFIFTCNKRQSVRLLNVYLHNLYSDSGLIIYLALVRLAFQINEML